MPGLKAEQTVARMLFGSHVYGTDTPDSDRDYKAVFIPSGEDILFQRATKVSRNRSTGPDDGKNRPGDIDVEEFSLHGYLKLLTEGQTVAVDMLFVPERLHESPLSQVWRDIHECRGSLIPRSTSAMVGYCRRQANKYGIKGSRMNAAKAARDLLWSFGEDSSRLGDFPTALEFFARGTEHVEVVDIPHPHTGAIVKHLSVCGRKAPYTIRVREAVAMYERLWQRYGERARQASDNEGIDWKAMMHAVRILRQAEELLATGEVTFPRPDAADLLRIRTGQVPYATVAEEIEDGIENRLPKLEAGSLLPTKVDAGLVESIIGVHYHEAVCGD